ncbi:hypothetical protein F4808DRAFT_476144 [Astrocystis sublimbata]|nr:hypothetical protein F4808DRAFT_476144 [Astrocystis sublimbata]
MLLSAFDDSLPPFLPYQLVGSAEDRQWLVDSDQDTLIIPARPIFNSTFDDVLPSLLLLGRSQLDMPIENDLWSTDSDEPGIKTDEPERCDWLALPKLADVTFEAKPDITNEEILRFYNGLSDNQMPSLPIAQNEGLSMSITWLETPLDENEGKSPHATTFEQSPRSVHYGSTAALYPEEEIKEAVTILVVMVFVLGHVVSNKYIPPAGQKCKDALQDIGDHISSRDSHPYEPPRLVHDRKRKRKGDL